jgi:hypothetical protein
MLVLLLGIPVILVIATIVLGGLVIVELMK